ncbi:DUF309 domain-containing protein [Paenibacillus zeisoli]|uniref:DUF309 domain-containing protein n=1 Tax=Paenibacillus zeisoli TaxID=2496267 RepID=A0A3S1DUG1_9BACL|nr:DUF309 domain-containing protein [Paenibacillus zeisoli]RUT27923.1 DUF309 domain-containing protein [Paenibacillus zeisoli]
MKYDPLYVAYLIYFNRDRDFFECHEVLEELWLARNREPLYKGLLQVAVGLFHFRRGNIKGSYKMLQSAADKLRSYPDDSLGIDLGKVKEDVKQMVGKLDPHSGEPTPYYDITIQIIDSKLERAVNLASSELMPNIPIQIHPKRGEKHALRDQKFNDK